MYANKKNKILLLFLIPLSLILFDQLSKFLTTRWGGFSVCNKGIAWGIAIPEKIFWLFWTAVIVVLAVLLIKISQKTSVLSRQENGLKFRFQERLAIAAILAGAFSNFIDRMARGCIVDFIDLRIWPVFNFADICIVLGGLLLLARILKLW